MSEISKQNKITIVLPLLDREIYTPIWVEENLFDDFDYIIADGSKTDANEIIFSKVLGRSNVKYIRYPVDESIADYVNKMVDAIAQVKTPYVMTCDNDDFLVYRGVKNCIDALEMDTSCGFSNGVVRRVFGLKKENGSVKRYYRLRPDCVDVSNLNHAHGIEGVKKLFMPYKYVWYGIYRVDVFSKIWRQILLSEIQNVYLIELLQGQLAFCISKMCYVGGAHYIRLVNPVSNSAKDHAPAQYPSQHGIFFDNKYRAEVLRMVEVVSDQLQVDKSELHSIYRGFYGNEHSYFTRTSLKKQLLNAFYNRAYEAISPPLSISMVRRIV